MSVILAIVIALGTPLAYHVSKDYLKDRFGFDAVLSAYAAEIVDTENVVAINTGTMREDNTVIDLTNDDGTNTIYLFSEPISYVDENGDVKTKDITVEQQEDEELEEAGYDYTNGQNDYRIQFSSDSNRGLLVQFDDCSYSIVPRTLYTVSGDENTAEYLTDTFEVFEYPNLYGEGTNLRFYPQLNGVKDEIVLNTNIGKNSFSFALNTENCTAVKKEDGTVALINDENGQEVQVLSAPFAYDSVYVEGNYDKHYGACEYTLEQVWEDRYYLTVTVDEAWMNAPSTVYPVIIDPTTSDLSNNKDAGAYSGKPDNPYGKEPLCCFGHSTGLGTGRTFMKFLMPDEIKKGATINSAYMWLRETTGETATSYVRPFISIEAWVEADITWNNKPAKSSAITMPRRNINSHSTDNSSPYWYKFNITGAVDAWANKIRTNHGLIFVSEDTGVYEWRAFASRQHSTSSYRPYTVINYKNETEAPRADVTKSTTAWTNQPITITISNAADNTDGVGLHATPYSFSTTSGSYSWSTQKSKSYSTRSTVYVSVRDALNNIRTYPITMGNYDSTPPTQCTVTGMPTQWTNQPYTLTATSTDSISNVVAYSFSTQANGFQSQTANTKTFTENDTFYVRAKDSAGNLSVAKAVTVDKYDGVAPEKPVVTSDTTITTTQDVVLTAASEDEQSGIAAYSFSREEGVYNWQESSSKSFSENGTVYVYVKDRASNISECTSFAIDNIDKETYRNVEVRQIHDPFSGDGVTLSVEGMEGLEDAGAWSYSFSDKKEPTTWQSSNRKLFAGDRLVYIYLQNAQEETVYLGTVSVGNVEQEFPVIEDVTSAAGSEGITVTVHATGNGSDITGYSFDGGQTWQAENSYTVPENSINTMEVQVKNGVGNIASDRLDLVKPEFYRSGELIGLYNPVLGSDVGMQYKISADGAWTDYTVPFAIPAYETKTVYARTKDSASFLGQADAVDAEGTFTSEGTYVGAHTESNTDFTLQYKGVSFAFERSYNTVDREWYRATDSHVEAVADTDGFVQKVYMPDGDAWVFVKQDAATYVEEIFGYELTVSSDGTGYTLEADNRTYCFGADGKLVRIEDRYGHAITITRTDSSIIVADGADRSYTLALNAEGQITTITDPAGKTITYTYDGGKLVQVVDQAGVTIGAYEYYADGAMKKSMDKTIDYEGGRVEKYTYDSGATLSFTYVNKQPEETEPEGTQPPNSVRTCNAIEETSTTVYNDAFLVVSQKGEDGSTTTYTYDDRYRVLTETSSEGTTTYTYDENGNITSTVTEGDGEQTTTYSYDDKNRLIREVTGEGATYYVYNEQDEVILTAAIKETEWDTCKGNLPETYDAALNCFDTVSYTYDDGLLVQAVESAASATIVYLYDAYGNQKKATRTTSVDGEESQT